MSIKLNLCDKLPVNVVLKCLDLGFPAFPVTLLVLLGVKSDAEQEQTLYGLLHVLTEPQKLVGIRGLLFGKTSPVEIERILKKQGQLLLCLYKLFKGWWLYIKDLFSIESKIFRPGCLGVIILILVD